MTRLLEKGTLVRISSDHWELQGVGVIADSTSAKAGATLYCIRPLFGEVMAYWRKEDYRLLRFYGDSLEPLDPDCDGVTKGAPP